jgi:hypothetical protein
MAIGLSSHRTVEAALSSGTDIEINARVVTALVVSVTLLGIMLPGIVVFS